MKVIEFDIALFEDKVVVCITPSIEDLKKLFPKEDLSKYKNNLGLAFGAIHKDKLHRRVIWLKKWNTAYFIHEAYHITNHILNHIGTNDQETGAYLIEFIYKETLKGLSKLKK